MYDLSHLDTDINKPPLATDIKLSERNERILHLHLSAPGDPQASLCDALSWLTREGGSYVQVPWYDSMAHANRVREELLLKASEIKPTIVWMQVQNNDLLHLTHIERLRPLMAPDGVIVTWCGDVSRPNSPHPDDLKWQAGLYGAADLVLYTSMNQVWGMRALGVPQAAYLQIGYDEDWFHPPPPSYVCYPKPFLATFIGNVGRYIDCGTSDNGNDDRIEAIRMLQQVFGHGEIQTVGAGWLERRPPEQTRTPYWNSICNLSISNTHLLMRYTSDRLFRALACGRPVMVKAFPGYSSLGLIHRENCMMWDNPAELVEDVREISPNALAREDMGEAGATLAKTKHTWLQRMREVWPYIQHIRKMRGQEKVT